MAHCGMTKDAIESAAKAVEFGSRLDCKLFLWAVPLAISYSLQVKFFFCGC